MKKKSQREIIRTSDMQDVVEILSKELKEQGYCACNCSNDAADENEKRPDMFTYKTTTLNYDIPLICRLRNLAIVFYQTFFHKGIEYVVVIRRVLKD